MNDQLGWLMGFPVIEDPLVKRPLVLKQPVEGAYYHTYTTIVVPNWREFENELWIETTLHKVIRENRGETLEWLYGEGASRRYVAPSSIYSNFLLRLEFERAKDGITQRVTEAGRKIAEILAPATRQVSREADGHLGGIRGFGSIRPVDFRVITEGS